MAYRLTESALEAAHRSDRRSRSRYPLSLQVKYKVTQRGKVVSTGTGQTVDMTSSAVAFVAEIPIREGTSLELALSWPVLLDGACPMQLTLSGRTIRSDSRVAVCSLKSGELLRMRKYSRNTAAEKLISALPTLSAGLASSGRKMSQRSRPSPGNPTPQLLLS